MILFCTFSMWLELIGFVIQWRAVGLGPLTEEDCSVGESDSYFHPTTIPVEPSNCLLSPKINGKNSNLLPTGAYFPPKYMRTFVLMSTSGVAKGCRRYQFLWAASFGEQQGELDSRT